MGAKDKELDNELDNELKDGDMEVDLENDGDDIEVEIVNDTPPEDRNREPLPDEIKKKLDEDDEEAKQYSKEVQKRINQLKKAYHDERRRAEAAERQLEEAATLSRRLHQERMELRKRLSMGESWALTEAKRRAELEMEAAKAEYKAAYESGDPEKIAEAQSKIARSTSHYDQVQRMKPQYTLQDEEQQVYNDPNKQPAAQPKPQVTERDLKWREENSWFGSDPEMTSFALGVHEKLVRQNVTPGSKKYYELLDARIRQVFPDQFDGESTDSHDDDSDEQPSKKERQRPSTVVAPVSRTPKGKKVVLTSSQVALAKKLGITPEDYAKELIASQSEV